MRMTHFHEFHKYTIICVARCQKISNVFVRALETGRKASQILMKRADTDIILIIFYTFIVQEM